MKAAKLKPYEDKTITLHLLDGEIATAKIVFVDSEYEDVIVNIVQTNRPDAYQSPTWSTTTTLVENSPTVKVQIEVDQSALSSSSTVKAHYGQSGGGTERTATGNVPVKILNVQVLK